MKSVLATVVGFLTLTSFATPGDYGHGHNEHCLSDVEALDISRNWLRIWSTGEIKNKEELATIVTADIQSYDETFGGPTTTLDELWDASTFADPYIRDVKQAPLFAIHSCDQISVRWGYSSYSTGYNKYVMMLCI